MLVTFLITTLVTFLISLPLMLLVAFGWWKQRRALKAFHALRVHLAGKGPMNFSMVGRLGSKEADALWQEACRLTDAALGKVRE